MNGHNLFSGGESSGSKNPGNSNVGDDLESLALEGMVDPFELAVVEHASESLEEISDGEPQQINTTNVELRQMIAAMMEQYFKKNINLSGNENEQQRPVQEANPINCQERVVDRPLVVKAYKPPTWSTITIELDEAQPDNQLGFFRQFERLMDISGKESTDWLELLRQCPKIKESALNILVEMIQQEVEQASTGNRDPSYIKVKMEWFKRYGTFDTGINIVARMGRIVCSDRDTLAAKLQNLRQEYNMHRVRKSNEYF